MASVRTLPSARRTEQTRRARNWRRAGLAVIWALVLTGASGMLGVRSGVVEDRVGEHVLRVEYARVSRAGAPTPLRVRVESGEGFAGGPITLTVSRNFFERLDFQNYYPNPTAETSGRADVYLEFDPPPGKVFVLSLDARTAPDQNGSTERVRVGLVLEGVRVAGVAFRTVVLP